MPDKQLPPIYCLRCKKKTNNSGTPGATKSKNGRVIIHTKCSVCGANKSKIATKADLNGGFLPAALLPLLIGPAAAGLSAATGFGVNKLLKKLF